MAKIPSTGPLALPAGLAAPALRALHGAGCTDLHSVAACSEIEIKNLHGIGPHALKLLRSALAENGLSFAQPNPTGE